MRRAAWLAWALSTSACLSVAGLDKDFTDDLGRAAGAGGARAGAAQAGDAGSTGDGGSAGGGEAGAGASQGGAGEGGTAQGGAGSSQGGAGEGGSSQGGAGASQGGAGASQGGAGSSALGGGPATTCPITTFTGLPLCADTGPFPCPACVCNDVSPTTSCGASYKACFNDQACSRTIECLLRACSLEECAPLAAGSEPVVQKFVSCMTNVCPSMCQ